MLEDMNQQLVDLIINVITYARTQPQLKPNQKVVIVIYDESKNEKTYCASDGKQIDASRALEEAHAQIKPTSSLLLPPGVKINGSKA